MIEQAVTTTKIIRTEHLTADDIDRLLFYVGGADARVCFIIDNNPLAPRDTMIAGLKNIRDIVVLNNVFPDPNTTDIMEMVHVLNNKDINVIVGIGGGSSMDSAKCVAAVLSNGGEADDYIGLAPTRKIEKRDIRLILMPTTVGTGSEVTKVGVYTSKSGRKYTLGNPLLQADIAVLVTDFVSSLPPMLVAATAFDALSHALETIWNKNATPLTDRIAAESAVKILKSLSEYAEQLQVSKPTQELRDALAELQVGACMAGTGFNITGTAAVHALSFILSEEWHVPHGIACAFTIEDVYRLNMTVERVKRKLAGIGKRLFEGGRLFEGDEDDDKIAEALLDVIVGLKKRFSLPFGITNYETTFGVSQLRITNPLNEDDIKKLFGKSLDDPKMKNNIIDMDMEKIIALLTPKLK
ncbi:MAG: iron-containing alcohol dehydrogenase [Tannerella sp.]|jgi:alcohol dehydrogenase class IV|nr:iron-containing alcohol dehydrogenase [Tannerella sp.]